jgi:hypothetical protein
MEPGAEGKKIISSHMVGLLKTPDPSRIIATMTKENLLPEETIKWTIILNLLLLLEKPLINNNI